MGLGHQACGIGHRQSARKVATVVSGGSATDRRLAREQCKTRLGHASGTLGRHHGGHVRHDRPRPRDERVRALGSPLPDDALTASDAILPGEGTSLAEVRALLGEQGLIPG